MDSQKKREEKKGEEKRIKENKRIEKKGEERNGFRGGRGVIYDSFLFRYIRKGEIGASDHQISKIHVILSEHSESKDLRS